MEKEFIRTYRGEILGSIEHASNGDVIARGWPDERILGYYRKAVDKTTDFYGNILSYGNTVISLLYSNSN